MNLPINKILNGDCLEHLKDLPKKSINMCMTSPPYWALRDYGTASWDGGDDDCNHITGRADRTITDKSKKQTTMKGSWANETRDICSKCGAKRVDKQLGLESTFDEYINKLCDIFDEVKRVLRDDGTCWVNIGDTYSATRWTNNTDTGQPMNNFKDGHRGINPIKETGNIPDKCLVMIPFRFSIEMVNRGWILRNTIIWHKRNCMPSSVKDRFTVDFEYLFFFSKKKNYYFETQREGSKISYMDNERVRDVIKGRIKHIDRKASDKEIENYDQKKYRVMGRNKRTVWEINPKPFKDSHFAVYPEELCETPIKAGCSKGGIVLDPFFGAGTTGVVALKQSKKFIGIELNPEYIEIAKARLKPYLEQRKLI